MREPWGWHHHVQGFRSTRVPWDSLVPEESGRDRNGGMLVLRRMSMSQAGKQSPEVGTIPALLPSISPALPSCPPEHGQKGAPGLQLGPSCREPGWEPQPGQSKIPSKGSAMEGEPIWRPRARVWWDCGSGHWMDAKGSRSILCSCSALWHRARFWEQSWFQGLLGTGRVQGCAALTNATSYIPAGHRRWVLCRTKAPGETEEPVKDVGREEAAQQH